MSDWKSLAATRYADSQCSKEDARDWDMYYRAYLAGLESESVVGMEKALEATLRTIPPEAYYPKNETSVVANLAKQVTDALAGKGQ